MSSSKGQLCALGVTALFALVATLYMGTGEKPFSQHLYVAMFATAMAALIAFEWGTSGPNGGTFLGALGMLAVIWIAFTEHGVGSAVLCAAVLALMACSAVAAVRRIDRCFALQARRTVTAG